ncbi:hypothetical protein TNCV_4282331 [Trichonephila clavipes]|nr:hypothetical protein TNCV_4282331 [Trichonephila clavipes]
MIPSVHRLGVGQFQAEVARWLLMALHWSPGYGINSKQVILSPGMLANIAKEHRHLNKIAILHKKHGGVDGQRPLSLLVTLLLCLEEEFPCKQSTVVLQRLAFTLVVQSESL